MISSYGLMGVNVVYTLISMPLALRYLSKAEFGLWALTLQVTGYIALIDLGMGSSIARILIDHKDDRKNGLYGSAIKSGFLVGLAQGFISLVVGLCLVWFLGSWLRVPGELQQAFLWLMIGQVLITAATFSTRLFNQMLYAWQRIDLANYSSMAQLVVGLGAMWLAFVLGWGVFSLLVGAIIAWVCGVAINLAMCVRIGVLPRRGEWGRTSREQFRELFTYGADVFLITMGTQLIMSSQTVLVSRQLGIDVAALWSVMTKVFTLLGQVVWRIIGNAMPAFAEMHVRKEHGHLWSRYRALFISVNVLAGVSAVIFAACNEAFVNIWMHGKFSWPTSNNVLLAIWLIFATQQCCHNSLIMCLKEVRGLKYVFLIEGVLFVGAAVALLPGTGLTGMLICSLAATVLFTWSTGLWRVAHLPGGNLKAVAWDWQLPLVKALALMVPCWIALEFLLRGASDWVKLIVNIMVLGLLAIWILLRFSFPADAMGLIISRMPLVFRRPISLIAGYMSGSGR